MGQMDLKNLTPGNPYPEDAWRCSVCNKLIYNLDKNGHPAPGAPIPHFVSLEYQRVCSACHALIPPIDRDYWRTLHRQWQERQEEWRKKINKLGDGKDYFGQ